MTVIIIIIFIIYNNITVSVISCLTDDLNPVLDLNMTDVNPQLTGIVMEKRLLATLSEVTIPSRC